jgi:hypothetical protein
MCCPNAKWNAQLPRARGQKAQLDFANRLAAKPCLAQPRRPQLTANPGPDPDAPIQVQIQMRQRQLPIRTVVNLDTQPAGCFLTGQLMARREGPTCCAPWQPHIRRLNAALVVLLGATPIDSWSPLHLPSGPAIRIW